MHKTQEFYRKYESYLSSFEDEIQENIRQKESSGYYHEAVLDKIRLGLTGTLRRMLGVSYQQALSGKSTDKSMLEILGRYTESDSRTYHCYLLFIQMLSAPWKSNIAAARDDGDAETVAKVEIKCELIERLRKEFINMYDKTARS